ncbi:T9SS type A sorting domain-containing protein [Flavobacteriaceae bacterium]|nr:T9SS type A sorting domain-containing protein [Flavobacteriaceae bacterium]
MKNYLLGFLCLPGLMFSQILTVSNGASISIENTASLNLNGLTLAPASTYVISENAISITSTPVVLGGNTSIDRVYDTSAVMNVFTGTITFAYEDTVDELNGISEADLTLETLNDSGEWTSHLPTVDLTNNTLSFPFVNPLEFRRITASSVNSTLSVEKMTTTDFVKVYPNPTTDKLIIVSKSLQKSILYNVSGQSVLESNRNELNVSQLPTGIYILHTTNSQNELSTFKIIKK